MRDAGCAFMHNGDLRYFHSWLDETKKKNEKENINYYSPQVAFLLTVPILLLFFLFVRL